MMILAGGALQGGGEGADDPFMGRDARASARCLILSSRSVSIRTLYDVRSVMDAF